MSDRHTDEPRIPAAESAPWWGGTGPVGGIVLILLGVGAAAALFLTGHAAPDTYPNLYGAAKVVAVGLVVAGTGLLAKRRRTRETCDAARPDEER
ncbi:hypothetical protein ABZ686_14235 [Streptomyces sp. NPDC006992]|uniref:hypothetical protein n=1 Tax=Streptomyces sp. NPDC006992 TaxID=3155601 RepID=UPI0034109A79